MASSTSIGPCSCIRAVPFRRSSRIPMAKPICLQGRRGISPQLLHLASFSGFSSNRSKTLPRVKGGVLRRRVASGGIPVAVFCSLMGEGSARGVLPASTTRLEKLAFRPDGYNYWTWRGRKIHYVEQGQGRPIVLIHGFGASVFHWRYNIPELAKKYKVYALDLLGFGWSEKAIVEYDATIWRDQVSDFIKDIVKEPAVLVGNSLGGFTALFTAVELPQLVQGIVLLNSAGQFGDSNIKPGIDKVDQILDKYVVNPLKNALQRVFLSFLFWQAKQPARIKSVLKSVYINTSNVDDYLVESIIRPAEDPNAGEVYYRLMTRFTMNQSAYTLDRILQKLSCPLLLLWGDLDPWVGPAKAKRIKEFYARTTVVSLQAGHCPHDEVPELVNKALVDWLSSLELKNSLQTASA